MLKKQARHLTSSIAAGQTHLSSSHDLLPRIMRHRKNPAVASTLFGRDPGDVLSVVRRIFNHGMDRMHGMGPCRAIPPLLK
jgi:hypothetical protein